MLIYKYSNNFHIKLFKSLADETRLRIIRILLRGTFHVNEIHYIVNGKQSNISHHLKILQGSQLISNKKEGSIIYYTLNEIQNNSSIKMIINAIKQDEKELPYYDEDIKRLETILHKRKEHAEFFFNSVGQDFDELQEKLFNNIYKIDEVVKLFNNKLDTILDIGCGTGRNLPLLAEYSNKIIGLDSSPSMLQLSEHICKKNNLNFDLKLGDIQKLPFFDESIDGVFINMVLHHISDPLKSLKEISRILTNKGRILLIELLTHQSETMRNKYADLWLGFSENELIKWLKHSNISVLDKIIKEKNKKSLNDQYDFKVIIILGEKNSM
jgi:ubiquinone/menaquinone biosynthesis C-methylase UbiE